MCLTPSSSPKERGRGRERVGRGTEGERENRRKKEKGIEACTRQCPSGGNSLACRGEEEGKKYLLDVL